ncbi:glutathione S-transferase family protein [Silvanigrella aquatica]|uniref:Glutathione S-transferase n=1 Tax=Silvanigrella aquatica TaxID=1915309 RepID=A0A1L4D3E5_9BACT|nr:glutathione S-transferase family protein [Silvanigrella aquatica]APJ04725.1 hypothetical protein AXG55_12770 [Silvanigrella aquatica]
MSSHSLILYECPETRSDRVKFLLEEIALPYEKKTLQLSKGEHKSGEYLAINPIGSVPFLIDKDAGISLSESGAICHYLAKNFKHNLYFPEDIKTLSHYDEMMFFATSTLDPICYQIFFHSKKYPPEKRVPAILELNIQRFDDCVQYLNKTLEKYAYALGNKLSAPDFIIAPTLLCIKEEVKKYPLIQKYIENILELPSMKKVRNQTKS